jgi:hypothetical protein
MRIDCVMDNTTKLILAKYQVEGVMNLIKDNPYEQYMFMHLNTVYHELNRQLINLQVTKK